MKCPEALAQGRAGGALGAGAGGAGIAQKCVEVKAAVNNEAGKVLEGAGVFGRVDELQSGMSAPVCVHKAAGEEAGKPAHWDAGAAPGCPAAAAQFGTAARLSRERSAEWPPRRGALPPCRCSATVRTARTTRASSR